jgi:hypothetical protein
MSESESDKPILRRLRSQKKVKPVAVATATGEFKAEKGIINKDNKLSGIITIDQGKIVYDIKDSKTKKRETAIETDIETKFTQEFLYRYNLSNPGSDSFTLMNGTIDGARKLSGNIIYNGLEYDIKDGKIGKKPLENDATISTSFANQASAALVLG